MSFLEPHYFQDFQGYVSEIIDTDTYLNITAEGLAVAEGRLHYVNHYQEEEALLETNAAWSLLQSISTTGSDVQMDELITQYGQKNGDVVKRALMKLIKQGYIAIKGDQKRGTKL
ncbi:hypothetical protein D1872_291420 [compost metagenome]